MTEGQGDIITYDTTDTGCDKIHEGLAGVLRLDQDCGGFDNGVDGLETSCFHGFTGFCIIPSY